MVQPGNSPVWVLSKQFKGIGEAGADTFFREVQVGWLGLYPSADMRARESAKNLSLPADANKLAGLVRGRLEFARLVSALVRAQLDGVHQEIRAEVSAR